MVGQHRESSDDNSRIILHFLLQSGKEQLQCVLRWDPDTHLVGLGSILKQQGLAAGRDYFYKACVLKCAIHPVCNAEWSAQ